MAVSKRTEDIIELTQWHTLADYAQGVLNTLEFFAHQANRLDWSRTAGFIKEDIRKLRDDIESERDRIMGIQK